MQWEPYSGRYISGILAKLGKWEIFRIFSDSSTSRDSECKYILKCKLPGIKETIGHFKSETEAKTKAESVFKYWMNGAGLNR